MTVFPKGMKMISIILVTRNQLPYTRQCLQSLREHTPQEIELIVVDNGSMDGTVEFLHSQAGVRVIANRSNRGYAAGCNQGLAVAGGDFLVLLNNDTIVTADWLAGLLFHVRQDKSVGLAGPLANSVAGSQRVPVEFSSLAQLNFFARQLRRLNFGRRRETGFISGMCMLVRREVVERIGGLDERFGYGSFEDDDFCVRAALAGYKLCIAQDVFIYHYGGRTFAGEGLDYPALLSRNWALYKEKWGLPAGFPPAQRHTSLAAYQKNQPPFRQAAAGSPADSLLAFLPAANLRQA